MALGDMAIPEKSERWGPLVPANAFAGDESIQVEEATLGKLFPVRQVREVATEVPQYPEIGFPDFVGHWIKLEEDCVYHARSAALIQSINSGNT